MKLAQLEGKPEIFYTLQGEGKNLGRPSIFVRLSHCNLHCIWCDTDYTWNWKGTSFKHHNDQDPAYTKYDRKQWIAQVKEEEVRDLISQYPCKNIVITGGEPLLQQREVLRLCQLLKSTDERFWIEVETNGTISPSTSLNYWIDQYNVSPKLKNSENPEAIRIKPETLDFFSRSAKTYFKYVIDQPSDLEEVLYMVENHAIKREHVYLMPEGTDAKQLEEKRAWLVEICKTHGFNYTDRLHIHIWGSKRGV